MVSQIAFFKDVLGAQPGIFSRFEACHCKNMSKIRIRNFGPIREGLTDGDGWITVKKVTVFTGNQGSGKSTVAKLISSITWIEKALMRGDLSFEEIASPGRFEEICRYQNIFEYFKGATSIEYEGASLKLIYQDGKTTAIPIMVEKYNLPKIMYVPAERNIVAAVSNIYKMEGLPSTLYTFATEYLKSLEEIVGLLVLPINDMRLSYNRNNKTASIVGSDFELSLIYASSGFQSFVPLFVVTKFLSEWVMVRKHLDRHSNLNNSFTIDLENRLRKEIQAIRDNPNLSETVKQIQIELVASKFEYNSYINIVEEPEQNLHPVSQRNMLNSLLEFNNLMAHNKLIMTTHSPYLINYLTLAVKAGNMLLDNDDTAFAKQIDAIVPVGSSITPSDLVIYELSEKDGTISILPKYNGIPTDDNILNIELGDFNDLFSELIKIENWR
jgi:energy-coupling factor transporter ATP-binding protein EcfA2